MRRPIAAAALALAVAGCGGGGSSEASEALVSPSAWMAEFCAAGVDWRGDLEANAADLDTRIEEGQSLEETRSDLVDYFDRAAVLTDRAVARIERAGTPEVEERERLVADFTGLVADMGDLFTAAGEEVGELETADAVRFRARVTEIGERLERRAGDVVEDFTSLAARYDTPALEEAFSGNEDCAQLSGDR